MPELVFYKKVVNVESSLKRFKNDVRIKNIKKVDRFVKFVYEFQQFKPSIK